MNRQLRGGNAPRRQQAAQPLQSPASFEGSENRSEWQAHQELDSVWDQHSGVGPQVISQGGRKQQLPGRPRQLPSSASAGTSRGPSRSSSPQQADARPASSYQAVLSEWDGLRQMSQAFLTGETPLP